MTGCTGDAWRALLATAVMLAPLATARAQNEPGAAPALFEIGFAGGGGWLPDYPAADQNHLKGIAVPFVTYRGEILRSDETGIRTRFYKAPRYEFDVSLDGALPASSEDNRAREGMDDLDLMGEIGPNLRLILDRQPHRSRLEVELALRGAFTLDRDGPEYQGINFAPEIAYRRIGLITEGSFLRVGFGPVLGTDGIMDYFYNVRPEDARQGRPEHEAEGGYLGSRLQGSFELPVTGRLSLTLGGRLDGFWGATNDDSPLFQRNYNVSVAGGFSVSLYQSQRRARAGEDPLD